MIVNIPVAADDDLAITLVHVVWVKSYSGLDDLACGVGWECAIPVIFA